MNINSTIKSHILGVIVILIIGFIHFFNCIYSPAYFLDELYYSTRAWYFIQNMRTGTDQYQIIYGDHPPLGWILMGLVCYIIPLENWMMRVRFFFGIMYFFQLILTYSIACKYWNKYTGIIANIIFGLIPSLFDQSRIGFLDNIAIVFVMLSFYFFYRDSENKPSGNPEQINNSQSRSPLDINKRSFYLSGIFFGMAVCIKFPMVFFLAGFFFFFLSRHNSIDIFLKPNHIPTLKMFLRWGIMMLIPLLSITMLIVLEGKLGFFLSSLIHQISRSGEISNIYTCLQLWMAFFPLYVIIIFFIVPIIFIITFVKILRKWRFLNRSLNKKYYHKRLEEIIREELLKRYMGLTGLCVSYLLFLYRGGLVLSFYIIPLLPIGALFIGMLTYDLFYYLYFRVQTNIEYEEKLSGKVSSNSSHSNRSKKHPKKYAKVVFVFIPIWLSLFYYPFTMYSFFFNASISNDQTKFQYEALAWIKENVPKDSTIIAKAFFSVELFEAGYSKVYSFGFYDPSELNNDWRNIDYLFGKDILELEDNFTEQAIARAILLKTFSSPYKNESISIYYIEK